MNILMIGGTRFIGPALVQHAVDRGHTLTLLHRGISAPDIFPDLEHIHADRLDPEALSPLHGRTFDLVIDTSAYIPRAVQLTLDALGPNPPHYLFISTISVYADFSQPGITEDSRVGVLEDPDTEEVTGDTYGPLKVACEERLATHLPGRHTIVRPGYIVGPGDHTDRFTYWPTRVAQGGPMIAPGNPTDLMQFIDVRDLATFCLDLAESRTLGTFNATGPSTQLGDLLQACGASEETLTWIPADALEAHDAKPGVDFPCWVPSVGEYAGFARVSTAHAIEHGLTTRPIAHTIRDTLAWWNDLPEERRQARRAGIDPAKEADILAAWNAQHS